MNPPLTPPPYIVTVTLTDNCNATTTRSFTLTVNPCAASLSKSNQSCAANGGADTFTVMINAGCPWTAVSNNPDWITITSGANGAGNAAVTYSVASNLSVNPRSRRITVAGQTSTVFQLGIAVVGLSSFKTGFDTDGKTDIGFYRAGLWGFLKSTPELCDVHLQPVGSDWRYSFPQQHGKVKGSIPNLPVEVSTQSLP